MGSISLGEDAVLQVQVAEIPDEGLSLEVVDVSWFPGREVARCGDLVTEVFIRRRDARVFVTGTIDLVMVFPCDRCLETFELPERISFRVVFDLGGENPAPFAKEHECDKEEMDVEFLAGTSLDLGAILAQQVILALPLKRLCRPDCLGLCPGCGEDLNGGGCRCRVGDDSATFGILRQLVTKKK